MYYDEDLVLDLRFNILYDHVDEFVIVESKFTHSGEKRKLLFDLKKYSKYQVRHSKLGHLGVQTQTTFLLQPP